MTARDHGSAHDTLRWGDVEEVTGLEKTFTDGTLVFPTKQLNQGHWKWPLSWTWWLSIVPHMGAAEAGTFQVQVDVTMGVGQAQTTFPLLYKIAPTGGIYLAVTDQRFFPAQDLQLRAFVTGAASQATKKNSLTIGSFLAPQTEPHAMTHMLDVLSGASRDEVEWIEPGFRPQPLHYRR